MKKILMMSLFAMALVVGMNSSAMAGMTETQTVAAKKAIAEENAK